ncbi:hypothetical protein A2419_01205 [Candidatus Adlerbacteria bacterium RIFOXYC1_FULL_48_26]|uniref:Uncharacterized protein n=1 Tax=Candidatus Adlerbacteria bacterium RIFOXYC1_FULL_48_26 TaxID=1797247 RepID=A0A1F4Y4T9_9BACT|nr:MAG: hypothetical protein A2419_01205 [Candidatus Adlerbacteria bacterium RIFOXYC1_FULL_48_26]
MALSWSDRRKYMYLTVFGAIGVALLCWAYFSFIYHAPTCFDGFKNGSEIGVDCGGSCALLCKNQTREPSVAWARSFLTVSAASTTSVAGEKTNNIYTAAAYIQNTNLTAGARKAAYSFQLFDAKNQLIIERNGVTDLPPLPVIPVIETNIPTGTRVIARTLFAFSALPTWTSVAPDSLPAIDVSRQVLAADGSRLTLTLENNTVKDISNIIVGGVLFDGDGVALAASKSLITSLPRKSSQNVTLTWPLGVPGVVRAEITVLPSF